ncbi:STAS domain-containing protein [Pseudochelatococcus sp. G4_1912]|uniref:STAS domain-containing protein n=1 Tax=Pseudochelatococcus sp. G4_1912 TaxID=3114288 RepID=UPI0039C6F563
MIHANTIHAEVHNDMLRIAFNGRLDTATSMQIQNEVMSIIENTPHSLVFDLAKVDFVASAFLRLCILSARKVGMERFLLTNVNPAVGRVFSIAGLDKHLKIT